MAPKIPSTIQCNSPEDLDRELRPIREILALEETEETWDKISNGILLLTAVVKGGACSFPKDLVASIKLLSRPINRSILSERSRLSGTAVDLIAELATGLQHTFEPLLPLFLPQLLALATRSSKLSISRAKICILAVLENTQLPSILGHLHVAVTDKSVSLRIVATESVLACMNCFNPPDLETQARAEDIEAVIRTTARDANADVRRGSRKIFEAYKILLPGRVDAFIDPLTPVTKKYLDIKSSKATHTSNITSSSSVPSRMNTLSSSTSALPSSKSSNPTVPLQPPSHLRSASEAEVVHVAKSSNPKDAKKWTAAARDGRVRERPRGDMGPPVAVPIRPQSAASDSTAVNGKTQQSSATSVSASRPPSRPTSAQATRPQPPLQNPPQGTSSQSSGAASKSRPYDRNGDHLESISVPRNPSRPVPMRPTHPAPTMQPATGQIGGGAMRPAMAVPFRSTGEPAVAPSGGKERILGGARRVQRPFMPEKAFTDMVVPVEDGERGRGQERERTAEQERPRSRSRARVEPATDAQAVDSNATERNRSRSRSRAGFRPATNGNSESTARSVTGGAKDDPKSGGSVKPKPDHEQMSSRVRTISTRGQGQTQAKPNDASKGVVSSSKPVSIAKDEPNHQPQPPTRVRTKSVHQRQVPDESTKGTAGTTNFSKSVSSTSSAGAKRTRVPSGVTAPTLSQLAKTKTNVQGDAHVVPAKTAKPEWGRAPAQPPKVAVVRPLALKRRPVVAAKPASSVAAAATPESIPLPPSPSVQAPPNALVEPEQLLLDVDEVHPKEVEVPQATIEVTPSTPVALQFSASQLNISHATTPISALLSSIQRGFMYTPAAHDMSPDTTLPFPTVDGEDTGEDSILAELHGVEFNVDGVDALGGVIESPRKKKFLEHKEPLKGGMDVLGRNIFGDLNL